DVDARLEALLADADDEDRDRRGGGAGALLYLLQRPAAAPRASAGGGEDDAPPPVFLLAGCRARHGGSQGRVRDHAVLGQRLGAGELVLPALLVLLAERGGRLDGLGVGVRIGVHPLFQEQRRQLPRLGQVGGVDDPLLDLVVAEGLLGLGQR